MEVPTLSESLSDPVINVLFANESVSTALTKVAALESFLSLGVKNCTFEEMMREILLTILRVIRAEAGSILEVNQLDQSLFFRAIVGSASDRVAHFTIPGGQGIVGQVIQTRQPVIVNNLPGNAVHLKAVAQAVGFEIQNLVGVPILIRGRPFGVLEVLNRLDTGSFTAEDVNLLIYLCDAAAKVIEMRLMIAWTTHLSK